MSSDSLHFSGKDGEVQQKQKGDGCHFEEKITLFVEANFLKQKGCKEVFSKEEVNTRHVISMMEANLSRGSHAKEKEGEEKKNKEDSDHSPSNHTTLHTIHNNRGGGG